MTEFTNYPTTKNPIDVRFTNKRLIDNLRSFNATASTCLLSQVKPEFTQALIELYSSFDDPVAFARFLPDDVIMTYSDINGDQLKGYRQDVNDDGTTVWTEIAPFEMKSIEQSDPAAALQLRTNYLKYNILRKTARKFLDLANRSATRPVPVVLQQHLALTAQLADVLRQLDFVDSE